MCEPECERLMCVNSVCERPHGGGEDAREDAREDAVEAV